MTRKPKKRRRAYLDDFKKNADGKYEYEGVLYLYQGERITHGKLLLLLWGLCAAMICAALTAGCIPAAGMDSCFYVLMPYVIGVVSLISLCWGMYQLTAGGNPIREYVYAVSVGKLPFRCGLTAVFAGCTCLGELLYLFFHGFGGKTAFSLLFLALELLILAASLAARRIVSDAVWEPVRDGTHSAE